MFWWSNRTRELRNTFVREHDGALTIGITELPLAFNLFDSSITSCTARCNSVSSTGFRTLPRFDSTRRYTSMVDVRNVDHTFFTVRTSGSGMPRRISALSIWSHTRALSCVSTLLPPSNTEMCSLIRLTRNSFISFGHINLPLTLRQFWLTPRLVDLAEPGHVLINFEDGVLRCGVFGAGLFLVDLLCISDKFFCFVGTHQTVNFWCRPNLICKMQYAKSKTITI